MSRLLRTFTRPVGIYRPSVSIQSAFSGHKFAMAHLSTPASGQTSWHGAGAAEFDLRSTFILNPDMTS